MMVDLVTIATFGDSIEANLAKQALEAEEITAFLGDEITVSVAWHLTVAVGWIKLQVPQPEAEQAMSILAATSVAYQPALNDSTESISQETLYSNREQKFQSTPTSEEGDDVVRQSWADRTVEQAFRAAVFGLIFFPLQLYSLWLLIRLLVSRRCISQSKYWQIAIAVMLNTPILVLLWLIFFSRG